MSEKRLIKHSASIQITNTVNIFQRRLWNILLANAYYNLPENENFSVSLKDLKTVIDFDSHNYDYLKESLIELIGCVVEWNVLGKDKNTKWKAFGLLASAKIEDGVLTYSYARELQQMLYNPKIYARISLSIQNKFKSKHSLALYELFLDYFIASRNIGQTPVIEIEQFRHLLGFTRNKKKPVSKTNMDRYATFKHLNNKVIKPSLEEINKNTEINVRVEYKKVGKKVTGLQFFIKSKNKMIDVAVSSEDVIPKEKLQDLSVAVEKIPVDNETSELKTRIMSFGINDLIADQVISKKSEEEILSDVEYINKNKENKTNLGGYAVKIFKDRVMPEEEKKQRERRILTLQKEATERLNNDYESYINNSIDKYRRSLESNKLEDLRRLAKEEVDEKIKAGELTLPDERFRNYYESSAENRLCRKNVKIISKKDFYEKYKSSYEHAKLDL